MIALGGSADEGIVRQYRFGSLAHTAEIALEMICACRGRLLDRQLTGSVNLRASFRWAGIDIGIFDLPEVAVQ